MKKKSLKIFWQINWDTSSPLISQMSNLPFNDQEQINTFNRNKVTCKLYILYLIIKLTMTKGNNMLQVFCMNR